MIEGMVSRLANRLASDGGTVDEWARLIRAYTVLHEADKAKSALASARKALAPTRTRSRASTRSRTTLVSETPIDPPEPPPQPSSPSRSS